MAIYNYGIGGNEVKVDANESIAEIPSNRTLIVQKLYETPRCGYYYFWYKNWGYLLCKILSMQ